MSGGGERYIQYYYLEENINFLQTETHTRTFCPAWNKENTFSADIQRPARGS